MIYQLLLIALCAAIVAQGIPSEVDDKDSEAFRDECYREALMKDGTLLERMGLLPKGSERSCTYTWCDARPCCRDMWCQPYRGFGGHQCRNYHCYRD